MVADHNPEITSRNLKNTIACLEDEKARLYSSLMQFEKMNAWLVRILFWRSKCDLLSVNRIRLQMIESDLARLRTKLFWHEKRRARTAQS